MAIIKLPKFDTTEINKAYKPRYTASVTTGLFESPSNPLSNVNAPKQEDFNLFGGTQVDAVPVSETEKRIKSLESQVANLETRLKEADAEQEPGKSFLEKAFNLPSDQVWWVDFFEVIDRPLQALKYGIAEGSLTSAWDAFSGNKEYKSGSQFLVDTGLIEKEILDDQWTKLFLDIGVDVVADPLNYITFKGIGKMLKKLGILSDSKIVTKFDEIATGMRRAGLIDATGKTLDDAVIAVKKSLNLADDVDIIRNFKNLDAPLQVRVAKELADKGIYVRDAFETYVRGFGQTIDSATGRVRFLVKNIAEATQMLDTARAASTTARASLADAVTSANRYLVDKALIKNPYKSQKYLLNKLKKVLSTTTEAADQTYLSTYIKNIEQGVEAVEAAKGRLKFASDAVRRIRREGAKAGALIEANAGGQFRDALQKQVNEVFDDVSVVVGNARSKKVDLEMFYRNKDGVYVKLNRAFEIKHGKRFSSANPSLRVLDDRSLKADAKKLRAMEKAGKKGTKQYQSLKADLLEQYKLRREVGRQPILRLAPGSEIRKLPNGAEIADKINKKFVDIYQVLNDGEQAFSFGEYIKAVTKYFKKIDDIKGGLTYSKLSQDQIKAIKALRDAPFMQNIPKEITATFTLFNKGDYRFAEETEQLVKLILDSEIAKNPNQVYGIIDNNNKLVLLTQDQYIERLKPIELSIQSKPGTTLKPEIQTKIYSTVDVSDMGDLEKHNSLFVQNQILGEEITRKVAKQTVEYKPGILVRMLNGIQDANVPFISPTIKLIRDTAEGIGFMFNSTKGLPDDLVEILAKVPAEDIQKAKVSVQKFQNIVTDVVNQAKGQYSETFVRETIGELIEQGWDGVTIAGRRMNVFETFKRWSLQYKKAGSAQFVDFASDIDFKNFQNRLADILQREGLNPNFITARRIEGATAIDFAEGVTGKEIDEVIEAMSLRSKNEILDLGKGNLTSEQLAFAKQYNNSISRLVEESVVQQNFLKQLGFEFTGNILGTGSYFRHTINPKMLQYLKTKSPASIKKFLDAGTDILKDRIYMGSISEINAGVKEMFGLNMNLFSTDAAFNFADLVRVAGTKNEMQTVLRAIMNSQDTMGRNLFEVIDDLEIEARGMRGNFKILNNSFKAEFPNLFKNVNTETQQMLLSYFAEKGFAEGSKVIAIQKSAHAVLKRLDNAYIQLPAFVQSYDQFMKFWKTFALITPGYHTRNFFGNMTNSFIAGMPLEVQGAYAFRTSSDFLSYRRVMNALYRGEDISKFSDSVVAAFKRVDDYYRSGASQSHRGIRDLEIIKEGRRVAKGQQRGTAKKIGDKLLYFNYQAAEVMDDMQRYSLYQWAFNKAKNSERVKSAVKAGASANEIIALRKTEAYKKVSEALFDYSHLTPFEQEYMKRLFPFYTFFKNNLIFQAKSIFQRPAQYGKLYRFQKYYTESMTGFEIEDLPNYMTDNLWLPMPYRVTKNNKEAIEWLRLNLPPSDFTEFVENPFARGVTSLTVPIKFFIEMGTGRDLFTGQQIREFPGQKDVYKSPGFLQQMRDSRGRLTVSSDPLVAKFLNDIGFRSIFNYGTSLLEIADYAAGKITREDMLQRIVDSLGLTRVQELDDMQIASLYQNIDKLRDLKDYYEQENDGRLPTLKDIADLVKQQETPQTGLLSIFN